MWFMGDWAWNYIKDSASADDEFGLMPCPLTGKEEDAVNTELGVFCSKGCLLYTSQLTIIKNVRLPAKARNYIHLHQGDMTEK